MRPTALALALALAGVPAFAQDTPETPPALPSSLQAVVEGVAGQLGRLIADLPRPRLDLAVVVRGSTPLESAGAGAGAERLVAELEELLAGAVSRREPLRTVRATRGEAWSDRDRALAAAPAEGYELLLWVEVSIAANHLVLDGVVFDTDRNIWREVVAPESRVVGNVHVRRRLDAELRRFFPAVRPGPLETTSYPLAPGRYLGIAVADLDGDDLAEIVLLGQRTLELRRLSGATAEVVARMKLTGIPRAATRSRDPVGALVVGPRDRDGARPLAFRTSEHGQGVLLTYDGAELNLEGTFSDYPVAWDEDLLCTTVAPGRSAFQSAAAPCGSLDETPLVAPYYAATDAAVAQPDGSAARLAAAVLADGTVSLSWNGVALPALGPYGTALAVTDVDDDGDAEVLLSSAADPGPSDELTVLRLGAGGLGEERQRLTVPGAVWVATSGDVDDDGRLELVAVVQTPTGASLAVLER
jgi:hypothetical protein